MIRVCFVCSKEFEDAPYYIREGRSMHAVCSPYCLKEYYKAEEEIKYEQYFDTLFDE
jgi:hypothetical protein